MRTLTLTLTDDTHAALKVVAARRRLGIAEAGVIAVEAWLDRGGSSEAEACRALLASVEDGQRAICSWLTSVLQAV